MPISSLGEKSEGVPYNMNQTESVPQFIDLIETLSRFDSQILEVTKVVESTYQVFEELKKEWNLAALELRENLARSTSLRKKDFDLIVQGVFDFQEKREREIRSHLYQYLDNQKEFSQNLKKLLIQVEKHKDDRNIKEIHGAANSFLKLKEEFKKKEKVFRQSLEDFKKEQKFIAQTLHGFLKSQGGTSKGFKETITNLLKVLENEEKMKSKGVFVRAD